MTKLVIVESPSKTKTIGKYLGDEYDVVYSKGHIRDLATKGKEGLGVDIENDFKPTYTINKDKKTLVKELKDKAKKADEVYLATDPDREGEAISWHLAEELGLPINAKNRVEFNEITKDAVLKAFKEPRSIDMGLVHSQETRRILDRIIGFKLSKLLMRKISSKSAGRVQSVALKLVVDREREIQNFVSEEYHTIHALLKKGNKEFEANLIKVDGKKSSFSNQEECDKLISTLSKDFTVSKITKSERKSEAKPPFITSTLQQEASRKLNYTSKKTMQIAQTLYEGVDIGTQTVGLITYMRTDSVRLSDQYLHEAHDYIVSNFGKEYSGKAKIGKKTDNVQDAHEAIRPTSIERTPDEMKPYLTSDQYKIYKLIYERALASVMAPAKYDSTSIVLDNNNTQFSATGSVMKFDGYLKVYNDKEDKEEKLPKLEENEVLTAEKIFNKQHFTEPAPRYTEARLIKEFEEKGIGRPSTYASIIDTLLSRDYCRLEKSSEGGKSKVFIPTEQGFLTNDKLQEYFSSIINVSYTADMETELDEIAEEKIDYIEALNEFYKTFNPLVEKAYDQMEKLQPEKTGEICPECGGELVIRKGRFGKFICCINYPNCSYHKAIEEKKAVVLDEVCPECGSPLVERKNRFGQTFVGCSGYPKCHYIKSDKKAVVETDIKCPNCGKPMVERTSRYGKKFIACSGYPKCKTILSNKIKNEEE